MGHSVHVDSVVLKVRVNLAATGEAGKDPE